MLQRERHGRTLILRLDRPEKLNAWDAALRKDVATALAEADDDRTVGSAVLTGTGPKAFCAGADLSDTTVGLPSEAANRMAGYRELYDAIQSFRKPLVAALNGLAVGSAFQAILLMDARVGHRGLRLGLPEVNSGIPCITGSTILSWSIGASRARRIATSGDLVEAEEALQLCLVDELVEPGAVLPRSIDIAEDLAQRPTAAFAETKLWFRDMMKPALDEAFRHAAEVRGRAETSQSIQSGVGRFLDRHGAPKSK